MKLTHLLTIFVLMAMSSCTSRYYYAPAMFQNDVQYMVKPHSKDSVKHGFYASGVLFEHTGANDEGSIGGGMANIYYAQTFENVNLSGGLLGFAGSFDNADESSTAAFKSKSFTGWGANASISGFIPFEKVDWRVLGVDLIYTSESGSYADFRKSGHVDKTTYFDIDYVLIPQTNMFTYSLFTEVVVKPKADLSLAFKLGFSRTNGQVHDVNNHVIQNGGFNAVVGYKKLSFISSIRFRPTDVFAVPVGVQFGAGYRF